MDQIDAERQRRNLLDSRFSPSRRKFEPQEENEQGQRRE